MLKTVIHGGLLALTMLVIVACGGTGASMRAAQTGPSPVNASKVPSWYGNIPKEPGALVAVGTAESRELQTAIDEAKFVARQELGRQLDSKIEGIDKRFREQTGTGADAQLLAQFSSTAKSIYVQTLQGARVDKQVFDQSATGTYQAYVLMILDEGQASKALIEAVKSKEELYTRFRATQSFEDLSKEIERFEASKRLPKP